MTSKRYSMTSNRHLVPLPLRILMVAVYLKQKIMQMIRWTGVKRVLKLWKSKSMTSKRHSMTSNRQLMHLPLRILMVSVYKIEGHNNSFSSTNIVVSL